MKNLTALKFREISLYAYISRSLFFEAVFFLIFSPYLKGLKTNWVAIIKARSERLIKLRNLFSHPIWAQPADNSHLSHLYLSLADYTPPFLRPHNLWLINAPRIRDCKTHTLICH